MLQKRVAFIHASSAALEPVKQFYAEAAPEMELTNLLDDGIMRLFASEKAAAVHSRLTEMIGAARDVYRAEVVMLTCSAVSGAMLKELRAGSCGLPVVKIDEPMMRSAVQAGQRIGVVVTFPPTIEPTRKLLDDTAAELGRSVEIVTRVVPEALEALLSGNFDQHDALLLAAINYLDAQGVDAIVLAQVSMARIIAKLDGRVKLPVLSSLHTSLTAVREALEKTN